LLKGRCLIDFASQTTTIYYPIALFVHVTPVT
jgi:hypothetical protein